MQSNENFSYSQISSSTLIKTGDGQLGGLFVSSGTPTITVYDNTAGSGTKIVDGFTATAATPYPFPTTFLNGLYVSLSGTGSVTVFFV